MGDVDARLFERTDTAHLQFVRDCIRLTAGPVVEFGASAATADVRACCAGRKVTTFERSCDVAAKYPTDALGRTVLVRQYADLFGSQGFHGGLIGCAVIRRCDPATAARLLGLIQDSADVVVVIGTDLAAVQASDAWIPAQAAYPRAATFMGASPWVTALSRQLDLRPLAAIEYPQDLARFKTVVLR